MLKTTRAMSGDFGYAEKGKLGLDFSPIRYFIALAIIVQNTQLITVVGSGNVKETGV